MELDVDVFKALSDHNRIHILEMLSSGEMCANEIMKGLALTQPTISHHMKILHHAGLVNSQKSGKWMNYTLNRSKFDEINTYLGWLSQERENPVFDRIHLEKN
jgi:ArsR family transcriptional regulator